MKKYISIIFAILILLVIALPLSAAQTAKITLNSDATTIYTGSTITFTVKVSGVSAAKAMGIIPDFDESVFELVSGEWLVGDAVLSDFSDGTAVIAYDSERSFNEDVFKFTLKVKSSAKSGSYNVTVIESIKNGSEQISSSVTGCNIAIKSTHVGTDDTSVDTVHESQEELLKYDSHSWVSSIIIVIIVLVICGGGIIFLVKKRNQN